MAIELECLAVICRSVGPMQLPSAKLEPGDLIGLDTIFMGTAARSSKHQYVQVFIDQAPRYVWAFPTIQNTASCINTLIDKLVASDIIIKSVLTYNHKNFKNKKITRCLNRHHIKQYLSTPYYP